MIDVEPLAVDVTCTDDALHIVLADGREISVPLVWSPRLQKAAPEQRKEWRLIGGVLAFTGKQLTKIFPSRVCSG
jgi:hypothetical protein